MFRKISQWIIVLVTVFCVAWDIVAYLREDNSTFSVIFTDWSFYSPWIPFLWGALMGHWFWSPAGSKYEHVDKK